MTSPVIDLGMDHTIEFTSWDPDLALNPQWAHLDDRLPVERWGAIVEHLTPEGRPCGSGITFAGPIQSEVGAGGPTWTVEAWEPLTLSPSLLCRACKDHGFIRGGRWVPA